MATTTGRVQIAPTGSSLGLEARCLKNAGDIDRPAIDKMRPVPMCPVIQIDHLRTGGYVIDFCGHGFEVAIKCVHVCFSSFIGGAHFVSSTACKACSNEPGPGSTSWRRRPRRRLAPPLDVLRGSRILLRRRSTWRLDRSHARSTMMSWVAASKSCC